MKVAGGVAYNHGMRLTPAQEHLLTALSHGREVEVRSQTHNAKRKAVVRGAREETIAALKSAGLITTWRDSGWVTVDSHRLFEYEIHAAITPAGKAYLRK